MIRVLGLALLLAGCATPNVLTFDRTSFAVAYGGLRVRLADACAAKILDRGTCAELRAADKAIVAALKAPQKATVDMETVMELLGVFVGAAK